MWDERSNQSGYAYGKFPNKFLEDNVRYLPKGNILCLAYGEG